MNIFQCSYHERLRSWRELRSTIKTLPTDTACVMVDRWWQQAPLVNHYLHWSDTANWPDPWTLLSENNYCTLTRALGMCYTLLMNNIDNIELVYARDSQCEEHNLVIVDRPKYILNFWPDSVISTNLNDFSIIRTISLDSIKTKIR
jgi:hypothetical protein